MYVIFVYICCRAPRGARGLKCLTPLRPYESGKESRPARGAWIEIYAELALSGDSNVAPREGRVD